MFLSYRPQIGAMGTSGRASLPFPIPLLSFPFRFQRFPCTILKMDTPRSGIATCFMTITNHRDESEKKVLHMVSRRDVMIRLIYSILGAASGSELDSSSLHARADTTGKDESELEIIQVELRRVLSKSKAAGILRLVFHDAGTFNLEKQSGGMNGSIIYELDRPENAGLDRPMKVLNKVKASLDQSIKVSWADLIAVAGAEAVATCGGPRIPVKLGRLDAFSSDPEGELPAESLNISNLKKSFLRKGFMAQELVVLSGAHTLGSKGFGNPTVFDNSYFQILLEKPWAQSGSQMSMMIGLPSDRALLDDDECLRWISLYAKNEPKFFEDFSAAYLKLVNIGAKWRTRQSI